MRCCGAQQKDDNGSFSICRSDQIGPGSRNSLIKVVNKDGLELVQLQIIFRHGARTPLNFVSGLPEATYERHIGLDLPETNIPHEVVNVLDGRPAGPSLMEMDFKEMRLKGGCRPSVLTTVGQKEMLHLGRKIKETYLPALKIDTYSPELVKLRSSHIDRTVKSLKCVLIGLFGRITLTRLGPIKIPVKDIWDEDLFPNKLACPALRLAVGMTLADLDSIPDYTADKKLVLRAMDMPVFSHLDFSCLKDDLSSRVAHGNPYPKILETNMQRIEMQSARVLRAVTTGRIEGSPPRDDVLMMSIGRLVHTILAEMEDVVCGVYKPRLYLYSGHDTTLTPLLEVLGIPQSFWPPFAASIALELYRWRGEEEEGTQYYVRVVYCWKEQILPCHSPDVLVPFPVFRQLTSRYTLSPGEFRRMCNSAPFSGIH